MHPFLVWVHPFCESEFINVSGWAGSLQSSLFPASPSYVWQRSALCTEQNRTVSRLCPRCAAVQTMGVLTAVGTKVLQSNSPMGTLHVWTKRFLVLACSIHMRDLQHSTLSCTAIHTPIVQTEGECRHALKQGPLSGPCASTHSIKSPDWPLFLQAPCRKTTVSWRWAISSESLKADGPRLQFWQLSWSFSEVSHLSCLEGYVIAFPKASPY